jgi:2-polyprenyl-3-methyl-5-hydroxy-6-metoxy-1,4-benzoquinol methylase
MVKYLFVIIFGSGMLMASENMSNFHSIEETNNSFYNASGEYFDKVPFDPILPELLKKYKIKGDVLEIGSGAGALALWLTTERNCKMTCVEPAQTLAEMAKKKGLDVCSTTIQNFDADKLYDNVVAISSLIHVPKQDLSAQIKKISQLIKPQGMFFVSLIEGEGDGFEDPTNVGRERYFAKWSKSEINNLLSPYFDELESHEINSKKMNTTFFLAVYGLKSK